MTQSNRQGANVTNIMLDQRKLAGADLTEVRRDRGKITTTM
ncbi:MAG: hypothetical protein ACRCT1_20975 [Microcoleaceae cyanobacterium]